MQQQNKIILMDFDTMEINLVNLNNYCEWIPKKIFVFNIEIWLDDPSTRLQGYYCHQDKCQQDSIHPKNWFHKLTF